MPRSTVSDATLVRDFFERLSSRSSEVLLPGTTGTYLFDITDVGRWTLMVDEGKVTVSETPVEADCVVICNSAQFVRLVEGDDNLVPAFLQGRLQGSGDLTMGLGLRRLLPSRP